MADRKVWKLQIPADYAPVVVEGGVEVMIEQFGDKPPAIAFRPNPWSVWGPPIQSEEAP